MQVRDAMTALAVLITAAFTDNPPWMREALVYEGSWDE
jgi:hypothetical protein